MTKISKIIIIHMEYSDSEVVIISQSNRSFKQNTIQSERNKTSLLFKKLPVYGKLLFSMFMVIIVNFLFSFVHFYLRKNISLTDMDLYSMCGLFGIVPPIIILALGILIEGKINSFPSQM